MENVGLEPYSNARPLILLGQDNWPLIATEETRQVKGSGLAISRSSLGWAVHGYIGGERDGTQELHVHAARSADIVRDEEARDFDHLDELIKQYFLIENLGVTESATRKNVDMATSILHSTSRKMGKVWMTGLLWKLAANPKTDGMVTAFKRLLSLERKLDRDPKYAVLYYKEIERLLKKRLYTKGRSERAETANMVRTAFWGD